MIFDDARKSIILPRNYQITLCTVKLGNFGHNVAFLPRHKSVRETLAIKFSTILIENDISLIKNLL